MCLSMQRNPLAAAPHPIRGVKLRTVQMEFLCTLCLGSDALSSTTGTSSHVAAATQQRKQKGLHPELPFVVVSLAHGAFHAAGA